MFIIRYTVLIFILSLPYIGYAQVDKALLKPITINEIENIDIRKEAQIISEISILNLKLLDDLIKYKLKKTGENSFFFNYKSYTRFFSIDFNNIHIKKENRNSQTFYLSRIDQNLIQDVSFCHEKYMHHLNSILLNEVNKIIVETFGIENQNVKIELQAFLSKKTSKSYLHINLHDDRNKELKLILISLPVGSQLKFFTCVY
jgi:hypothetical protein